MIRRRRIEVHIERHELSIYSETPTHPANQSPISNTDSPQTAAQAWRHAPFHTGSSTEESALLGGVSMSAPPARPRTAPPPDCSLSCPICGAHEMLPLAKAIALARVNAGTLKDGLETGRFHLHCSLAGEWLVCTQSMEAFLPPHTPGE